MQTGNPLRQTTKLYDKSSMDPMGCATSTLIHGTRSRQAPLERIKMHYHVAEASLQRTLVHTLQEDSSAIALCLLQG